MDYLHTHSNSIISFYASDMILKITSNTAYMVLTRDRIQEAAHYHLVCINNPPQVNVPLHISCQTLKHGVGSTTKAETGDIYIGSKHACPILTMLK